MKSFLLLLLVCVMLVPVGGVTAVTAGGDESTPIIEKTINYKDWTFASLSDGKPVNLREHAKDKRLVLVVYFAPWCGNWRNEAPLVRKLYDKYKEHGFDVIAVSEYAPQAESQAFFKGALPYTVVVESDASSKREQTTHYAYRRATGDTRTWGSPSNVFLEPAKFNPKGDVLIEKTFIANGELIEADAERFIRERLGLKN